MPYRIVQLRVMALDQDHHLCQSVFHHVALKFRRAGKDKFEERAWRL